MSKIPETANHPKIRPLTDEEKACWPKTVLVELEKPFTDNRGSIQPLVDTTMESCVLISSTKGTQRANHYHRNDWHYCYVLEGEIEYYERPHGSDRPATKTLIGKDRCSSPDRCWTTPWSLRRTPPS